MSQPYYYCTGPILVYVDCFSDGRGPLSGGANTFSISTRQLLGTCETYPTVEAEDFWLPVYNDNGGPLVPADNSFCGHKRTLILDLNWYSQTILNYVLATPAQGNDGFPQGTNSRLMRGAFQLANGLGFSTTLQFTFFGTPNAIAYPDLPPGEYYPFCRLVGTYFDRAGTQNKKVRLIVEAQEAMYPDGTQFLYSTANNYING